MTELLDVYRALGGAQRKPRVELRRAFCNEHERDCQTYGGYWRSSSAEQGFGPAGVPGVLDRGPGSPRWKQRAFYDFTKDLAPLTEDLAVSRLSIWEEVASDSQTLLVGELLDRAANEDLTNTSWPAVVLQRVEEGAFHKRP